MERFALLLYGEFQKRRINVKLLRPVVIAGLFFKSSNRGYGKWLGYIDKWIFFPLFLWLKRKKDTLYHICDHSNAFYIKFLPKEKTSITCHDVLAIKGALGDESTYCKASFMGKLLQKWILHNLKLIQKIATVSAYTLKELKILTGDFNNANKQMTVIHNGYNCSFKKLQKQDVLRLLEPFGLNNKRYLLHVGSALPRKNRQLLLEMLREINDDNIIAVFAGKDIDASLKQLIHKYGLQNRCISIAQPSNDALVALYNNCEAFIFPSYAEGFGWPVIEAQACGAAVIASHLEPMTEVGGTSALYADPDNASNFIDCLHQLKDPAFKASVIEKGFENVKRFSAENMARKYLAFIKAQHD